MKRKRKKKKTRKVKPSAATAATAGYRSQDIQDAQEAFDANTAKGIKASIALLKRVPKDFRDMVPFSPDWRALAKLMGPEVEDEMTTWARGGVFVLAPINDTERAVLNNVNATDDIDVLQKAFHNFICELTSIADANTTSLISSVSYIYVPQLSDVAIGGLNELCSLFGEEVRFKGQLLDSRGYPLGIVY